ncbi:MAG: hypothetical protein U0174_22085 [Polyangiaceae bacterium]
MTKREGAKKPFFASPIVQASVPALYAWAITVAPVAFGKGGTTLSQFFALLAITSVLLGLMAASTGGREKYALPAVVWGMTLFSSGSFLVASPRALSTFDTARGTAGVLGWLLFALASAAPALRRTPDSALAVKPLKGTRGEAKSTFGFLLGVAFALSIVLQGYGWTQETAERAVLLRVASIVLSLLLIGLSTKLLGVFVTTSDAKVTVTAFRTVLRVLATLLVVSVVVAYSLLRT